MTNSLAQDLMLDFAKTTGLAGTVPPRRYLWTDAFAVCNFLAVHRQTGEGRYLELARRLIDQVHEVLGQHRDGDPRQGWISGLSEEEGRRQPTAGGLRIGKSLNERGPDDPFDPRLEWDRDGQYFHYLTKWMHALHSFATHTGEDRYLAWARQLAETAHEAFTYEVSGGPMRMVWKMSVDLSRSLVPSMGRHDPLDGLVTFLELQRSEVSEPNGGPDLTAAIADMDGMCEGGRWVTDDPLGIGGLLDDAARLAQLVFQRDVDRHRLLIQLLMESKTSLAAFADSPLPTFSSERRLAFRELGLAIGIHAIEAVRDVFAKQTELAESVGKLLEYRHLAEQIEAYWSAADSRRSDAWTQHDDINTVMLATSLTPEGCVSLEGPAARSAKQTQN